MSFIKENPVFIVIVSLVLIIIFNAELVPKGGKSVHHPPDKSEYISREEVIQLYTSLEMKNFKVTTKESQFLGGASAAADVSNFHGNPYSDIRERGESLFPNGEYIIQFDYKVRYYKGWTRIWGDPGDYGLSRVIFIKNP